MAGAAEMLRPAAEAAQAALAEPVAMVRPVRPLERGLFRPAQAEQRAMAGKAELADWQVRQAMAGKAAMRAEAAQVMVDRLP